MKQRFVVRVDTLTIGDPSPQLVALRRKETATAVYLPEADRCETSLQYLEELFDLETKITLQDGEIKDLVVLGWRTTGLFSRTRFTRLSVDDSSRKYIIFNHDGLRISPWRIWALGTLQNFFEKLTFHVRKLNPVVIGPADWEKHLACSEYLRSNTNLSPKPQSLSQFVQRDCHQTYVQDGSKHREPQRRVIDCMFHRPHAVTKFDRRPPLMKDGSPFPLSHDSNMVGYQRPLTKGNSQVRDTSAESSNQRPGGNWPGTALVAQEQSDGSAQVSEDDDDSDSDATDNYWEWDPNQQHFFHREQATDKLVICPDAFD